jgi:hypothetical protein
MKLRIAPRLAFKHGPHVTGFEAQPPKRSDDVRRGMNTLFDARDGENDDEVVLVRWLATIHQLAEPVNKSGRVRSLGALFG